MPYSPMSEFEGNQKRIKDMIEQRNRQRREALGWMLAYAGVAADEGKDIRQIEVPEIIEQAERDLGWHD